MNMFPRVLILVSWWFSFREIIVNYAENVTPDHQQLAPARPLLPVSAAPAMDFPDYDCIHVESRFGIEWRRWLLLTEKSRAQEWIQNSGEFLQLIDKMSFEEWGSLAKECPYGFATFLSFYLLQCLTQSMQIYDRLRPRAPGPTEDDEQSHQLSPEKTQKINLVAHLKRTDPAIFATAMAQERNCYDTFRFGGEFSKIMAMHPVRILFGTRWPILTILSARNIQHSLLAEIFSEDREKNCYDFGPTAGVADWAKLHRVFWKHDVVDEGSCALEPDEMSDLNFCEGRRYSMTWQPDPFLAEVGEEHGGVDVDVLRWNRQPEKEWYTRSLRFVFHNKLRDGAGEDECPLGSYLVEVLRGFTAMTSESRFFLFHEVKVRKMFAQREPGDYVFTAWPFFMVFNHIRKSTRHKFEFDFGVWEFLHSRESAIPMFSPGAAALAAPARDGVLATSAQRSSTSSQHETAPSSLGLLPYLARFGSKLHRSVVETLLRLPDVFDHPASPSGRSAPDTTSTSPGFAYTTMVYGATFLSYLPSFLDRWLSVLAPRRNLVIFALDDETYARCAELYEGCVAHGRPGIVQKFTIPWVLAIHGVDSVWVDFDVYPVQDPTPHLLEHQQRGITAEGAVGGDGDGYEILISGSFAAPCICNGIVYFRATRNVVLWLVDVISWVGMDNNSTRLLLERGDVELGLGTRIAL